MHDCASVNGALIASIALVGFCVTMIALLDRVEAREIRRAREREAQQ